MIGEKKSRKKSDTAFMAASLDEVGEKKAVWEAYRWTSAKVNKEIKKEGGGGKK